MTYVTTFAKIYGLTDFDENMQINLLLTYKHFKTLSSNLVGMVLVQSSFNTVFNSHTLIQRWLPQLKQKILNLTIGVLFAVKISLNLQYSSMIMSCSSYLPEFQVKFFSVDLYHADQAFFDMCTFLFSQFILANKNIFLK